ncbi:MAG: DUF3857 domain-containing protein [Acidobacteriota bacterium]
MLQIRTPLSQAQSVPTGTWVASRRLAAALIMMMVPAGAGAAGFTPVTAEERDLLTVPWQPDAPAVVLFEKAELDFMDYPSEVSSILEVHTRIKILKESGKEYGEVAIFHSSVLRLKELEGRTIKPDGTVVPLTEDAIFKERASRAKKSFVTKAAFPALEVGSIIDYRYKLRWDSLAYLEPWYFHNEIPTLLSEITYIKPDNMALEPRSWATGGGKIELDSRKSPRGYAIRAWMTQLGGIPEEPSSFPFADLSSRFMMIPREVAVSGTRWPLFDSWQSACELYEDGDDGYKALRRKARRAKKKALELAAAASSMRDKAATVHAFVRDEIQTLWFPSVDTLGRNADEILAAREGTQSEKALLLQAMLDALKIDTAMVWASDRRTGRVDLEVANPWWFERILIQVELDGERHFLDPGDRRLGFGQISPYYENTPAVLHGKKPEVIQLPATPFEKNLRRAKVDLSLDEAGQVRGEGEMVLSGHHAWRFLRWKDSPEEAAEAWQQRLGDDFEGYAVSDVNVTETLDERRVEVSWQVVQRAEDVLGDEASLIPSLPLGPIEQRFALPPDRRKTPVQFAFADRDEVEMTVSWPDSWEIDVLPTGADYIGPAGVLSAVVAIDEANRQLSYSRRFDITLSELFGRQQYAAIRDLYSEVESHDAQSLVLVRH